jgi:hypothetical protein
MVISLVSKRTTSEQSGVYLLGKHIPYSLYEFLMLSKMLHLQSRVHPSCLRVHLASQNGRTGALQKVVDEASKDPLLAHY